MSSNYPAGQYDDAFNPRRLGNWEVTKENYSPPRERQPSNTRIVANEKGHLLPNIYRNSCSSPWGSLDKSQWLEESLYKISPSMSTCSTNTIRQDFTKIPKFNKRKPVPNPKENIKTSKRLSDFERTSKDAVSTLKKLQLPVIWVIGLPTRRILNSRRNFCRQLADTLDFVYINLDERIDLWRQNQITSSEIINMPEKAKKVSNHTFRQTNAIHKVTHDRNLSKRAKQNNINVCVETVIPAWTKENLSGNVKEEKIFSSENAFNSSAKGVQTCRLSFNLSEFFSRETIFEMLQFAMFESLPTNGFVIEGFPYDRAEAAAWEKLLYPSALALYFIEGSPSSKPEPEIKPKTRFTRERTQSNNKITANKVLLATDKMVPVIPKYIRRFLPYSLPEAERICEKYSHKLIRIINAEDVVFGGGMNFLSCLVEKALSQYSNILSGKTKINYESDSDNSYISNRGSALSKCDEKDNSNFLLSRIVTPEVKAVAKTKSNPRLPRFKSQSKVSNKPLCSNSNRPQRPPIKKLRSKKQSAVSNISSKPKTPPSSYEYCLPTPTLFTIGDYTTCGVSCYDDDDEYKYKNIVDMLNNPSSLNSASNAVSYSQTPLSWLEDKVSENEECSDSNESQKESLSCTKHSSDDYSNRCSSKNSSANETSRPSSEESLHRFFESQITRPESEDHSSSSRQRPFNDVQVIEPSVTTTDSRINNSYTSDSDDDDNGHSGEYQIQPDFYDCCNEKDMAENDTSEKCTMSRPTSGVDSEIQVKNSEQKLYHDRGDSRDVPTNKGDEYRLRKIERVNEAGEDFESHFYVYSSHPQPL